MESKGQKAKLNGNGMHSNNSIPNYKFDFKCQEQINQDTPIYINLIPRTNHTFKSSNINENFDKNENLTFLREEI